MAYTGLANAEFVAYEMTRAGESPNTAALASGIAHARRAIALDPKLAEAHAALSFLLAGQGSFDAARHAAEEAVHLAPDDWRQHFRLGHASWGHARLGALARALAFYPDFAYAQFERAMVLVARGEFGAAATIARDSVAAQDRDARSANRFPAIGFHWLAGALAAADGREAAAIEQFDREIALVDHRRLYGPEYGAAALVGRGYAELALGEIETSLRSFQEAERHVGGYARAIVGQLAALHRLGRSTDAATVRDRVERATARLKATGREPEAALVGASATLVAGGDGAAESAADQLHRWLDQAPVSPLGWWIPLEPGLAGMRGRPDFQRLLARLAERAR
jgi:tetratricopeptide (TPR) repeat protein